MCGVWSLAFVVEAARYATPRSAAQVFRQPLMREANEAPAAVVSRSTLPCAGEVRSRFGHAAHVVVADMVAAGARTAKRAEGLIPAAAIAFPTALIIWVEGLRVAHTFMVCRAFIAQIWTREQIHLLQTIVGHLTAHLALSHIRPLGFALTLPFAISAKVVSCWCRLANGLFHHHGLVFMVLASLFDAAALCILLSVREDQIGALHASLVMTLVTI